MPKLIVLLTLQVFEDNPALVEREEVPPGTVLSRMGSMDSPFIRVDSLDELKGVIVNSAGNIGDKATEGLRKQIKQEAGKGRQKPIPVQKVEPDDPREFCMCLMCQTRRATRARYAPGMTPKH